MTKPRLVPNPQRDASRTKGRVYNLERQQNIVRVLVPQSIALAGVVTIAAANTVEALKRYASYVCTGADDDLVITAALKLVAARGGMVYLLPGDFYFGHYVGTFPWFTPPQPIGSAGATGDEALIVSGSGPGTFVHFTDSTTGQLCFAQSIDLRDMTIVYEGDPTVGRDGAAVVELSRVTFWHCRGSARNNMIDARFYGRYAPAGGYTSGLDFYSSAGRVDRCVFAMTAPNDDCVSLTGSLRLVTNSVFGLPQPTTGDELFCRSAIHVGGAPFAATLCVVQGNRMDFGGAECEYGIRGGGTPRGTIVADNTMSINATNPGGFTEPAAPYIVGLSYLVLGEYEVTIRSNWGEGAGTGPVGFLPEQGYGAP